MNYLEYLLKRIKREIHPEILNMTFSDRNRNNFKSNTFYSMDERIIQDVILDIVWEDFNMLGGAEHVIPLDGIRPTYTGYSQVFNIPRSYTGGKRILSVLSVNLPADGSSYGGLKGAMYGPEAVSTCKVNLTGVNTIEIRENISMFNMFIRCRLGLEPNFSDWPHTSMEQLGDFAVLAAKMHCYNQVSIAIGDGALNGGSINPYLRQGIDEMSDAATMYRELKQTRGRKLSIFRDPETRRNVTRMIMPTFF